MNGEWMSASKCPYCGGHMTVRDFYSFTMDYAIKQDGHPSIQGKKSQEERDSAYCVMCDGCLTIWNTKNILWNEDGIFIREEETGAEGGDAPAFMETIADRDARIEELWRIFGDLPMNPETETMEEPFLTFPVGTHREEIWHWFDERYSRGVATLLYG